MIEPTSLELNIKLCCALRIVSVSMLNDAIEADTNEANPALVILDFGEPPVGVEILLAAKSPSIVTSAVMIPPCSKNFEPVIPPSEDNINASLVEFILLLDISNPPIKPSEAITEPLTETLLFLGSK